MFFLGFVVAVLVYVQSSPVVSNDWSIVARRSKLLGRVYNDLRRELPNLNHTAHVTYNEYTPQPWPNDTTIEKVVTCYYTYNASGLLPAQINAHLCTHIMLIGETTPFPNGTLLHFPNDSMIAELQQLKQQNPKLKLLITLTSYGTNQPFIRLVRNNSAMQQFAQQVVAYLNRMKLDGFDLDWEFPGWQGEPTDKRGFSKLLMHLRTEMTASGKNYLLTAAVAAPFTIMNKAYEVKQLNKYLDFINLMTYDYHIWQRYEPITGHNAPLFKLPMEISLIGRLNTAYTAWDWHRRGMDSWKIAVGIPTYARGFKLLFKWFHWAYSPAANGYPTNSFFNYPDICDAILKDGFTAAFDKYAMVPYAYKDHVWYSYENLLSATIKSTWINEMNYRGAMVYSLNNDDFQQRCGPNSTFPIIKRISNIILKS